MKKILFLILFVFNLFCYSSEFYYSNLNYINVNKIDTMPVCSSGSNYVMFEEIIPSYFINLSLHNDNLSKFSTTKFYSKDVSYDIFYQLNLIYDSNSSKYNGSILKFRCVTNAPSCSSGYSIEGSNQCYSFTQFCSSNQVFDDRLLVGTHTCVDICPSYDIFNGSSAVLYFVDVEHKSGDFVTNTHLFCDVPAWDKTTCEQHSNLGFKWVEKDGSLFSTLLALFDGVGLFSDSRCVDTRLTTPTFFGMGTSITSTVLKPRPNLLLKSVDKELIDTYIIEKIAFKDSTEKSLFKILLEWFSKEENVNTLPKNSKNNPHVYQDYNFADMVIETTSTGKSVLVPKFTVSNSSNNRITISNSEFSSNLLRSSLDQKALVSSLPSENFSYTPELLQAAVQTVKKTQFEIPTSSTVGEAITIKAPAVNSLSGVTSTIRDYPAVVSQINGNTRVINTIPDSFDDSNTLYTITQTTKSDNSVDTDVKITSTLLSQDGRNFTFSNRYNYTTNQSGSLISSSNFQSTLTSHDGTVYTTPRDTVPVEHNFNSTQQNLDELINIKPNRVFTGFDGLVSQEQILSNDVFSFLGELKNNFTNVYTEFQNIFASLQNKPVVIEKQGSCLLTLNMFSKTYTNDLCSVIRPARPFISVFLTFFGTIAVFMFAFKNKD